MRAAALFLVLIAAGCSSVTTTGLEDLQTRPVRLPDGAVIRVEVMMNPVDMRRGMMFRPSLAPNRGMLFVHDKPGTYTYWMYNVEIPLDIVWMNSERRIVEISADTPPCRVKASECPQYGGRQIAQFVLELAGGQAAKHRLQTGQTLSF